MDYRFVLLALMLMVGWIYGLWRLTRDIGRRWVMPPRMSSPYGIIDSPDGGAPFAAKTFSRKGPNDRRMAIKGLILLIVAGILTAFIAKCYPHLIPEGRRGP